LNRLGAPGAFLVGESSLLPLDVFLGGVMMIGFFWCSGERVWLIGVA